MGIPCAPTYVTCSWAGGKPPWSLVLHLFRIRLWARYICDIFIIWQGPHEEFVLLVEELYQNNLISKSGTGELNTTIYQKPTATNSLLHWQSSHPMALKKGIPRGQYLRLRPNS